MNDIEQKIRDRAYQSPSRARSAVSRSHLGKKDQARLRSLIEAWENEGPVDHVVAGQPEALEAELVDAATNGAGSGPERLLHSFELSRPAVGRLNLNAAVRVKLTAAGIAALYSERKNVVVPDDLVERQGVWETQLWELMVAFGSHLHMGSFEPLIVGNVIDVLDTRMDS